MADTPTSSETSSPKISKQLIQLLNEKDRLAQLIIASHREFQTFLVKYLKNQDNIMKLQENQLKVLQILARYRKTWEKNKISNSNSQDTDTIHMLKGINQERNAVGRKFTQFSEKVHKSMQVFEKFDRKIDAYNDSLVEFNERVMSSESQVELANLSVPSLRWTKRMPDPRTNELLADWEKLQLFSRITYLYEHLQQILYPQRVLHVDVHSHDD